EVLEEHARRGKCYFFIRLGFGLPSCESLDIGLENGALSLSSEEVLKQDSQRVGKPTNVVAGFFQGIEPEDRVTIAAGLKRGARAEAIHQKMPPEPNARHR